MKDIRCGVCNALLLRMASEATIEIKCRRCGTLTHLRAVSPQPERHEHQNEDVRHGKN